MCFGTTGTATALGPPAGAASVGAARILVGGSALAVVAVLVHLRGARRAGGAVPRARASARPARVPSWVVVAIGAGGVLAYQPTFFAGTRLNGVAVGTVVALGSAPVLTGGLQWALRRAFPGRTWLAATTIATGGVVLLGLAGQAGAPSGSGGLLGPLASLAAGGSYAVYTLASKELLDRGWSGSATMGWVFGCAAALSLPLLAATDTAWLTIPSGLAMAAWLGLVTTTVAYLLFARGLTGLAPSTASTLTLAEPLTASLLGLLVLHERLEPLEVAGLGVLAVGILVLVLGSRTPPLVKVRPRVGPR